MAAHCRPLLTQSVQDGLWADNGREGVAWRGGEGEDGRTEGSPSDQRRHNISCRPVAGGTTGHNPGHARARARMKSGRDAGGQPQPCRGSTIGRRAHSSRDSHLRGETPHTQRRQSHQRNTLSRIACGVPRGQWIAATSLQPKGPEPLFGMALSRSIGPQLPGHRRVG